MHLRTGNASRLIPVCIVQIRTSSLIRWPLIITVEWPILAEIRDPRKVVRKNRANKLIESPFLEKNRFGMILDLPMKRCAHAWLS